MIDITSAVVRRRALLHLKGKRERERERVILLRCSYLPSIDAIISIEADPHSAVGQTVYSTWLITRTIPNLVVVSRNGPACALAAFTPA